MAIINFSEQKHSTLFYDIRIFIFGCEVTPWISGQVSITHADRYGPSQAQFTLSNPMNAFELTYENLGSLSYEDRLSINQSILEQEKILKSKDSTSSEKESAAKKISEYSSAINFSTTSDGSNGIWRMADQPIQYSFDQGVYGDVIYSERAKKEIFNRKRYLNIDSNGNYLIDPLTNQPRYPLNPKSLIFHKHDPVRIFLLNPLKEPKRNDTESSLVFDEEWMYGFTGFIEKASKSRNAINDESTISIECKCIKGMTQLMRFQTNVLSEKFDPATLGLETFQDNVGFFADLRINNPVGGSHPLSSMSLEESVSILITGQGSSINEDITASERYYRDTSIPNVTKGAVGRFTLGNVYFFNGLNNSSLKGKSNLGNNSFDTGYDLLQDWYDLCLFGTKRDFLTREDVDYIGSHSGIGQDDYQSPWNQQLFILLPGKGTGLSNVTQYSIGTISDTREWDTRFNLLLELVGNLDYQWWTTPAGDMVVEFPMMDFHPEDFGQYKSILEYDMHYVDSDIGDESGEIISFLTCTGNYAFDPLNKSLEAAPVIPRITIQSDMLALRFGVIGGEPKNFPFLLDAYDSYQPGGAYDFRLARLGLIEFQKRISEFNVFSFNATFRPFLLPNKPVYLKPEERMATTTGISLIYDTISYTASSNTAVRYVRTIMPDGRFTLITGADSMPLSYREVYDTKETYKINKGLYVRFDDSNTKKSIKQ